MTSREQTDETGKDPRRGSLESFYPICVYFSILPDWGSHRLHPLSLGTYIREYGVCVRPTELYRDPTTHLAERYIREHGVCGSTAHQSKLLLSFTFATMVFRTTMVVCRVTFAMVVCVTSSTAVEMSRTIHSRRRCSLDLLFDSAFRRAVQSDEDSSHATNPFVLDCPLTPTVRIWSTLPLNELSRAHAKQKEVQNRTQPGIPNEHGSKRGRYFHSR
jgi:hypothetical protein